MKNFRWIIALSIISMLFLAGCQGQSPAQATEESQEVVFRVGTIGPLTGDAASVGIPVQKVIDKAASDVNSQWEGKNMRLEFIHEDGKCNGKDALTAAQKLVNVHGIQVIFGGECSGETLGLAPFTEENQILVFSSLSSSPEVTNAGDYVFRNYPSDTAQVEIIVGYIQANGWKKVAMLSENTDYAQGLRMGYQKELPAIGAEIVWDEAVAPNTKDVRTEVSKIKAAKPEVLLLLPQTPALGGIFAKQIREGGINTVIIGNDVLAVDETLNSYSQYMEGYYLVESYFDKANDPEFLAMTQETGCELGFYCASTYDGVILLSQLLEACADNSDCIKDKLYATKDWNGKFTSGTSFDQNGDVGGSFKIYKMTDGKKVALS